VSPSETSQLTTLINEIQALRKDVAVLKTKLLGDEDAETEQGRIPMLEAEVKRHKRKLARYEPVRVLLNGAWLLFVAAFGYFLNHFFPIKGH
jgi:hypothetical protein